MTLKCGSCGSLNANTMTSCGKCGARLAQTDRFEISEPKIPEYYATSPKCPLCGRPMDEGMLRVSGDHLSSRWASATGEEIIGGVGFGFLELEGYRCTNCTCMTVYY